MTDFRTQLDPSYISKMPLEYCDHKDPTMAIRLHDTKPMHELILYDGYYKGL